MVSLFAPDGTLGEVPYEQMHAALQAGAKMAVQMKAPDGTSGYIPADQIQAARKAGGTVVPFDLSTPTPKQYFPGRSFGMDVARGMGLDADKIAAAEDQDGEGGALKELGSQVLEGLKGVLRDPLSPISGSASNFEDAVKSGSPGKIVGAVSSILGGAEAAEEGPGAARDVVANAARDETGKLRPGVKVAARAVGAAAGHATGIPGAEIAGVFSGPSLADALIPSREPTVAKAVPIRQSPNFNAAAYKAGQTGLPAGNPTPFALSAPQNLPLSTLANPADDLISRTQRLVIPDEMPTVADIKRAGDLTQAPVARLRQLAKFGDRLAQNELNRRLKNP